MNYIQYKEEKLPLKLAFKAMKKFNADSGKNIADPNLDLGLEDMEHLFYAAYVSGCKAEGREVKYKKEEAEDILDEVYHEFVSVIPKLTAVKKKSTIKK